MNADFFRLFKSLRNENLLKTETLFSAQKQRWFEEFKKHFQSICAEIIKLQSISSLQDISCIEYTMLYTDFIKRRYVAEVWVYGKEMYLDKNQHMIGEFDVLFLFVYFDELWNEMLSARKRYVGKVTAQDVTTVVMQTLPDFYSYLINIARVAIVDLVDTKPFIGIARNKTFRVSVGGHMAGNEPVFTENKDKKKVDTLVEWFSKQLLNEYTFEDYSGLDFSGHSIKLTDLRYSNFRYSSLSNVNFFGSALIGSNFRMANMDYCCLDNCSIYEADFSFSTLKNASFVMARGQAGLQNCEVWRQAGFLPVSFRYADLTNADFTGANLSGADFTGAILDGAVFTDTVLN